MPTSPTERQGQARRLRLHLEDGGATASTTSVRPDGTELVETMRVAYRPTPHGLCRWTDPADGLSYVVGSGALDGAAHFVAATHGPADRMQTDIRIEPCAAGDVVRSSTGDLASHHLGLVAGPWRVDTAPGVEMLSRRSLRRAEDVARLLAETRQALLWARAWFGAAAAPPWAEVYTQVLVPDTPWLAMEHPGCVLLSERLLDARPGTSVAVIAHEAAHQWLGNLVSPRSWRDVGTFEGLAELLGQLACEELLGASAAAALGRRRATGPLALPPTPCDLRDLPLTAGLAEVAGPVQHAAVFRQVAAEMGADRFRLRVREVVGRRAASACSAPDLWEGLRVPPRHLDVLRLPPTDIPVSSSWRAALERLEARDPTSAAAEARRVFRRHSPGAVRARQALAVMSDATTPPAVSAGLAAELTRHPVRIGELD